MKCVGSPPLPSGRSVAPTCCFSAHSGPRRMTWTDVFRREWMNYVVRLPYKIGKSRSHGIRHHISQHPWLMPWSITPNFSVRREPWNCLGSCWEIDAGPPLFILLQSEMPTHIAWTGWCDQPLSLLTWNTWRFLTLRTIFEKGGIVYVFSLWATYVMFSASLLHGSWPSQLSYSVG
jgi:hypothetical protein